MMLRSDGLCYNPIDLQQFAMQDRSLKPPEDVLACPRPLIERRLKPQNDQVLKCPRCDSLNTKFCYFNNYSLSQPRHFCKNCRRYWTKGGALRNVPVGGGCRKNKRAKQRIVEQSSTGHQNESGPSVTHGGDGTSCQPLSDNLSGPAPNSVFYNLASKGDEMNLAYAQAQAQVLRLAEQPGLTTRNSGLFGAPGNSQLTSFPHSTLASLSSHISSLGGLHSLRSGLMGLDFGGTVRGDQENLDFSAILDPVPPLTVASSATSTALSEVGIHPYNLALDALNGMEHEGQWKAQQKMVLNPTENRNIGNRQMFSYENQTIESLRNSHLRPAISSLSPCRKVEEDCCHPSEWQAGQEGLFTTAPDSTIYCWNNGAWADLSGYTPSATSFL